MDQKYAPLFTPTKIGNCELKNRVVITSMGGTSMIDWNFGCKFAENTREYYLERARNDVGLIIPGITMLRSLKGNKWLYKHPEMFRPVKDLVAEMHTYGAKVFTQLTAGMGRSFQVGDLLLPLIRNKFLRVVAKPFSNMDLLLVSVDDGAPNVWMPEIKHRALTVEEIQGYVTAYAQTALLCKNAGLDGVEVHAVHEGYLLDQFTLNYCNHRTDAYGGSFENRYRFPVEVVKAIKDACGPDFPVSLRYSVTSKTKGYNSAALPGEEFVEAGRDMEESERAVKYLREAGYDAFNSDNGTYDAWYWAHPPTYMPFNCNLKDVSHIKKFTDAPVICAGRMQPDVAAEAIANGDIDCVGIARQFLCDSELLVKIKNDQLEDIRPCISCHSACFPLGTYKGGGCVFDMHDLHMMSHCALNPRTLEEKKYEVKPAKSPKAIAVIGGGIGGMETAIQASKRGHKVTLYEKSDELGGVFIAGAVPSFKEKDKELLKWYKRQLEMHPVEVKMGTEVKALSELEADEIVIATGAKPRTLNLPGVEKAVEAIDYLRGNKEVGDTVAVIGGGLTGCEIAYELALNGKKPFVVEMLDDLMKVKGICAANSNMMRDLLKFHKVPVYLEASLAEIKDGSVVINTKDGAKELPADSVITSVGYTPDAPLADKGNKKVHVVGDASTVGNLRSVIWAANDLVLSLSN